jgi:hypothetical protein
VAEYGEEERDETNDFICCIAYLAEKANEEDMVD